MQDYTKQQELVRKIAEQAAGIAGSSDNEQVMALAKEIAGLAETKVGQMEMAMTGPVHDPVANEMGRTKEAYALTGQMMGQYMDQYAPSIGGMAAPQQIDPDIMNKVNERTREITLYDSPDEWKPPITLAKEYSEDPAWKASQQGFTDYLGELWDGIVRDLSGAYDTRRQQVADALTRRQEGEQGDIKTTVQVLGKGVAGPILDTVGEVVIEGAGMMGDGVSLLMPDYAEGVIKEGAKDTWNWVINTEAGQAGMEALGMGIEAYTEWAEANPADAATLESVVNIAMLLAPSPKAKPTTSAKSAIAKAGDDLLKPLAAKKDNAKNVKILDTFMDTEHVADIHKRTNGAGIIQLTPMEKKAIEVLPTVKGYKMSKSQSAALSNSRVINQEITNTSQLLDDTLKAYDGPPIKDYPIYKDLQGSYTAIIKDTLGEADKVKVQKIAADMGEKTQEALRKHGLTPKGVLAARRELDELEKKLIKEANSGMGWSKASPEAQLFKATRDRLNQAVTEAVPEAGKALDRMSALLFAQSGVTKRAASTAGETLASISGEVGKIIGVQRDWAFAVGSLAGGAVGYATVGPWLTGLAVGGYGGYQAYRLAKYGLSPEVVKANLGRVLHGVDNAIKMTTMQGNKEMAQKLRADRAALMEIVKEAQATWNSGGKEAFEADMEKEALAPM